LDSIRTSVATTAKPRPRDAGHVGRHLLQLLGNLLQAFDLLQHLLLAGGGIGQHVQQGAQFLLARGEHVDDVAAFVVAGRAGRSQRLLELHDDAREALDQRHDGGFHLGARGIDVRGPHAGDLLAELLAAGQVVIRRSGGVRPGCGGCGGVGACRQQCGADQPAMPLPAGQRHDGAGGGQRDGQRKIEVQGALADHAALRR
jgi:hypothetical protein